MASIPEQIAKRFDELANQANTIRVLGGDSRGVLNMELPVARIEPSSNQKSKGSE